MRTVCFDVDTQLDFILPTGALPGAMLLLYAVPASAACALDAIQLPVTMAEGLPVVPVKIDGQGARLVVGSGAVFNQIEPGYARAHRLRMIDAPTRGTRLPVPAETLVRGPGGPVAAPVAMASSFEFADTALGATPMIVLQGIAEADGVLGQEVLHRTDGDYDLAGGVIQLVRATGCQDAKLAYWARAGTYWVIPLEPSPPKAPRDVVTITINGLPIRAMLDSGAPTSFITAKAAARTGIRIGEAGVTPTAPLPGLERSRVRAWKANFKNLQIGAETLQDAALTIVDASLDDADMVLGMDFFLTHHLYVANSQRKVYVSANAGPAFGSSGQDPAVRPSSR